MATYEAIAHVSTTLRQILMDGFSGLTPSYAIELKSPKDVDSNNVLSLFLYRVMRNPDLNQRPPELVPNGVGKGVLHPAPLALDLYYMITPFGSPENNMRILGLTERILKDNAIVTGAALRGSLAVANEEIRISETGLTQDVVTQVWQALETSMKLACYYLASPVFIDSVMKDPVGLVEDRQVAQP